MSLAANKMKNFNFQNKRTFFMNISFYFKSSYFETKWRESGIVY